MPYLRRSFGSTLSALIIVLVMASSPVFAQTQDATAAGQPLRRSAERVAASAFGGAQPEDRVSDSVLNGALIGAGVAVATGLFFCTRTEPWENCRDDVGPMLKIGALGAGIGIAIDALIRRRPSAAGTAPAARLDATPLVTNRARGLRFSLAF
jgi:hypothetical protein